MTEPNTSLKCKVKTIVEVNYGDLESFIKAETGHEYEIACMEEMCNDEDHKYSVDAELDEWKAKDWEAFKNGSRRQFILRTILCGLCSEGKIPAADYLVRVSW